MPYFEVMLHGHGIEMPIDGGTRTIAGFYTTRVVKGADVNAAKRIAVDLLATEWRAEPHGISNGGDALEIEVEAASRVSFLRGLLSRRKGYAFYPREK